MDVDKINAVVSAKPLRLLVVEDSPRDAEIAVREIRRGGFDVTWKQVETAEAMRTALREKTWDIILCDYQMPQFNGLAAIGLLKESGLDIPLIIISGVIGEDTAVECMRTGASDYIMKGPIARLVPAIERELREAESRRKRKTAEEGLVKESKRLDLAQLAAKAGIWDWDIATGQIEWSRHMYGLFGLDPQRTTASFAAWRSTLHPEDVEIAGQRIDWALKERMHLNSDYRVVLPDGRIRWINAVGDSEHDSQGRPVRMIGICIDITDRKLAEESLKESEEQYRSLFENANEAIFVVQDGKLVFLNPITTITIGYSAEELMARPFIEFIHPDDRDLVIDRHVRRMKGEEISHLYSFRVVHRDGNIKWVEASAKVISWQGKAAALSFISDITERKQVEEKELRSRQSLDAVMDSMDALAYVADMETYDLLFLNKYGRDTFPGFAPGKKCYEVLQTGQTSRCSFCNNDCLVDAAGTPTGVYRWEFKNTKTGIWFECRDQAIHWHSGRLVRLEIATDITELKRHEEDMKKQIEELRRWHSVTRGREERVGELKCEVNELLTRLGENPKYET